MMMLRSILLFRAGMRICRIRKVIRTEVLLWLDVGSIGRTSLCECYVTSRLPCILIYYIWKSALITDILVVDWYLRDFKG